MKPEQRGPHQTLWTVGTRQIVIFTIQYPELRVEGLAG